MIRSQCDSPVKIKGKCKCKYPNARGWDGNETTSSDYGYIYNLIDYDYNYIASVVKRYQEINNNNNNNNCMKKIFLTSSDTRWIKPSTKRK